MVACTIMEVGFRCCQWFWSEQFPDIPLGQTSMRAITYVSLADSIEANWRRYQALVRFVCKCLMRVTECWASCTSSTSSWDFALCGLVPAGTYDKYLGPEKSKASFSSSSLLRFLLLLVFSQCRHRVCRTSHDTGKYRKAWRDPTPLHDELARSLTECLPA